MRGALAVLDRDAKFRLVTGFVMNLSTGYFGRPGHNGGKTHVVAHMQNGTALPICGTHLPKDSEYQWCSDGINREYLRNECKRCGRAVESMRERLT